MPELPEVENVVRGLRSQLEGRRILFARVMNPAFLRADALVYSGALKGRTVQQVARRGKYIQLLLSSGRTLVFHLGMTGKLYFALPSEPIEKHTHLLFGFEDLRRELRFSDPRRFGGSFITAEREGASGRFRGYKQLGPEPLEIQTEEFHSLFRCRRGKIKALLLDQGLLAGLGNIYADEALHRARIHPLQTGDTLNKQRLLMLHREIVAILRDAIQKGGSSISDYVDPAGFRGQYQHFYRVYGRTQEPCLRAGCTGRVRRILVAGRSTHYCPRCQRLRGKALLRHRETGARGEKLA